MPHLKKVLPPLSQTDLPHTATCVFMLPLKISCICGLPPLVYNKLWMVISPLPPLSLPLPLALSLSYPISLLLCHLTLLPLLSPSFRLPLSPPLPLYFSLPPSLPPSLSLLLSPPSLSLSLLSLSLPLPLSLSLHSGYGRLLLLL